MTVYSTAAPVVSAVITTKGDPENIVNTVNKGDTVTGLVLEPEYPMGCPCAGHPDIEIETATVLGFQLGALNVPRGVTRVYDGVPTYMQDPDGNGNRDLVEETMCVKAMIIEIPAKDEGGRATTKKVMIERIKTIGGVEAGSTEDVGGGTIGDSSEDGTGEDDNG